MKKRKILVIIYLLLFTCVNVPLELNYYNNNLYYRVESFVVDSKGAVIIGKHGVIDKYKGNIIDRVSLPESGSYTLSITSNDDLIIQVGNKWYVFDKDNACFIPDEYSHNGKMIFSYEPNTKVFVSARGNEYTLHENWFQRIKIIDMNGKIIFMEEWWNYLETIAKQFQAISFILALFMVFSGGRPILFIKISLSRFSEGKMMNMDQFDSYVLEYYRNKDRKEQT